MTDADSGCTAGPSYEPWNRSRPGRPGVIVRPGRERTPAAPHAHVRDYALGFSSRRGKSTAPLVIVAPAGAGPRWRRRRPSGRGARRERRRRRGVPELLRGVRHDRVEQDRHRAERLRGRVEDRRQAGLALRRIVLRDLPGLLLGDVAVDLLHEVEDRQDAALEVHVVTDPPVGLRDGLRQPVLDRLLRIAHGRRLRQCAAEVLADHRGHARREVAVVVRQLARVAGGEVLPGERAVLAERDGAQKVPAVRVHAEVGRQVLRFDARQVRLRHLLAADHQPAVGRDLARQREVLRHQHRGPDDRVEAEDVLADQMYVGGEGVPELLRVLVVADRRRVVQQCVDPHVDHVLVVPRDRDAPVEGGTGDGEVLEALADEVHDLVARRLGLDEVRVRLVVGEQLLAVLAELEEVVLLLEDLHRLLVDGTQLCAVLGLDEVAGELVLLTAHAVRALVAALVDLALVVEILDELLDTVRVTPLRRADEVVVRDLQVFPEGLPGFVDKLVRPLLRADAVRLRGAHDLLAMLVRAGEIPHPLAALTVPAGEHVACDGRIGVAQVRSVVDVINGGGDVVRLPALLLGSSGRHGRNPTGPRKIDSRRLRAGGLRGQGPG